MRLKLKKLLEKLFGFSECADCDNFSSCNRKPYLHSSKDVSCNYWHIHNVKHKN